MKQITVGKFIESDCDIIGTGFNLYVIKDHQSDIVFYVGQSIRNVTIRLHEHLGKGHEWGGYPGFPSQLGRCIIDNLPKSKKWIIQSYHHSEIVEISSKMFLFKEMYIDQAEEKLIDKLRPCLNIMNNSNGRELPEEYQNRSSISARVPPPDMYAGMDLSFIDKLSES